MHDSDRSCTGVARKEQVRFSPQGDKLLKARSSSLEASMIRSPFANGANWLSTASFCASSGNKDVPSKLSLLQVFSRRFTALFVKLVKMLVGNANFAPSALSFGLSFCFLLGFSRFGSFVKILNDNSD